MTIQKAISDVRDRVAKRPPTDERNTCFLVIEPLLEAAGYDRTEMVLEVEDLARKRPDYTILPDTEFTFFLEAKLWGMELQDIDADQATKYPHTVGKRWSVLTNGKEWRLYDDLIFKPTPEKLVAVANIEDPEKLERFLTAIGKWSVQNGKLAEYAAAEVIAWEFRQKQQAEKMRADRIRASLDEALEVQFASPGTDLVTGMYAILAKQETLSGLKAEDIVAYFSEESQQPELEEHPTYETTNGQRNVVHNPLEQERTETDEITVTLPNGQVRSYRNLKGAATAVFVDLIEAIGIDKVKQLDLYCSNNPLISKKAPPTPYHAQQLRNGEFLFTTLSTEDKMKVLEEIKKSKLHASFKIEGTFRKVKRKRFRR